MIITIDHSTPEKMVADLMFPTICSVCCKYLAVPFVWVVFEEAIAPYDHFVHPCCLSELHQGKYFTTN